MRIVCCGGRRRIFSVLSTSCCHTTSTRRRSSTIASLSWLHSSELCNHVYPHPASIEDNHDAVVN